MPTLTQPTHARTADKNPRRNRRRRSRARHLNRPPPITAPTRPPTKRRRLRDQDSLNLQECLYECDDRGFHLDQDVHIGHAVSCKGNPFSLLDLDVTDPTALFEDPSSDPTNTPSGGTALMRPDSCSSPQIPEPKSQGVVVSVQTPYHLDPTADVPAPTSPPRLSIPTTLDAATGDSVPDPYPGPVRDEYSRRYRPGYLNDIHIPNPILFEHQSQETLALSDEKDFPSFELAYSHLRPQPAFTSLQTSDGKTRLLEDDLLSGPQKSKFIAAALPLMGRALDNPDIQHHFPTPDNFFPPVNDHALVGNVVSNSNPLQQLTHTNLDPFAVSGRSHVSRLDEVLRQGSSHPHTLLDFAMVSKSKDDTLISANIHPWTSLGDVVPTTHVSNHIVMPWAHRATSSNKFATSVLPDKTQSSDTLQGRSSTFPADSHTRSYVTKILGFPHLHNQGSSFRTSGRQMDNSVFDRLSNCTDDIPVKMHRHQITRRPTANCNSNSVTHAPWLSQTITDNQKSGTETVSKIAGWLTNPDHPSEPGMSGEAESSHGVSQPLLSQPIQETGLTDPEQDLEPSPTEKVKMMTDDNGCQYHPEEDEAYYSAAEEDADIEMVNGTQSDDEWADLEWDFETPDEEERVGL